MKGFLMYLIRSVEALQKALSWLTFYFIYFPCQKIHSYNGTEVCNKWYIGLIILSLLGGFVFWGTKNAADLEMYIFSRYLKDTSIIYNWGVLNY